MKSLAKHITEGLIQPHEIGMPTDMLFRTIALNSDISLIQADKRAKERLASKITDVEQKLADAAAKDQ